MPKRCLQAISPSFFLSNRLESELRIGGSGADKRNVLGVLIISKIILVRKFTARLCDNSVAEGVAAVELGLALTRTGGKP